MFASLSHHLSAQHSNNEPLPKKYTLGSLLEGAATSCSNNNSSSGGSRNFKRGVPIARVRACDYGSSLIFILTSIIILFITTKYNQSSANINRNFILLLFDCQKVTLLCPLPKEFCDGLETSWLLSLTTCLFKV